MQRAFCTLMKTSACRNFSKLTAAFHLPPTKKFSLISLNTRLPWDWKSEGDVKCWHGIQSRLDGCDCINTEGYPCRLSEAWCTALERKRMHGHGTDTIWKAKQDLQGTRPKLHEAEKSESPKKTNSSPTTGLGKQDSKQHLASFVRESSEESNAMVLLLPASPCETTGFISCEDNLENLHGNRKSSSKQNLQDGPYWSEENQGDIKLPQILPKGHFCGAPGSGGLCSPAWTSQKTRALWLIRQITAQVEPPITDTGHFQ